MTKKMVEPAPRPTSCGCCGKEFSEISEEEMPTHMNFRCYELQPAAASSPVARPQPLAIGEAGKHLQSVTRKVEWPEDDPDTDMAEPAARVEQPTCQLCNSGLIDVGLCSTCAAPVVEQRELEKRIRNQRKELANKNELLKQTQLRLTAFLSQNPDLVKEALKETDINVIVFIEALVAAEQRTEGEGQPK